MLNLWFWHPWLTSLSEQKKTHKVLNKAQNVKFTFIIFSQSVALDTWNAPLTTLRNQFRRKTDVFVQWPKTFIQIVLLPEILWKWSSAQVGYGFENNALLFCWKSKFFLLKDQNWLKKQIFHVNFTIFFLSARWSVVWHTWLNNFAKRQRNHSNSKDDNRKRKLFRKRNLFSSKYFSRSANFCCLNPRKNSLTERPIFSSQSPKKVEIMFNFKKKMFSLKTLKRYVDYIWQPCR